MIGPHLRDPVTNWTQYIAALQDGTPVKLFWTEGAAEVKAINPNLLTVRRHHIDHQDPYIFAPDHAQAARNFFNTFVDGTFRQYAWAWDYIEELNEYASHTNDPAQLAIKIEWARTVARIWHDEYRTQPDLAHIRLVVGNLPIGNDWGPGGHLVAQACAEYDAVMGYHTYIPTRFSDIGPDEWLYYSGRWEAMDADYRAHGHHVDWMFTEGGPIGYLPNSSGGIGPLSPEGGWRHPEVCDGNMAAVTNIMEYWLENATDTVAYNARRVLGLSMFDSAFNGWEWFQFRDGNLQALCEWSGDYPLPVPDPEEEPVIYGIDVSHHQGVFPWQAVDDESAEWVQFAILRTSYGLAQDTQILRNMDECARLSIPYGCYHFLRASQDMYKQAVLVHGLMRDTWSLPLWLDIESSSNDALPTVAQIDEFVAAWRELTPHPIGIYTSYYMWNQIPGAAAWVAIAGIPLWVAHWTSASQPLLPPGWSEWVFWQYMVDADGIPGYRNPLDRDRFNGDVYDLYGMIEEWTAYRDEPPPDDGGDIVGGTAVFELGDGRQLVLTIHDGTWEVL